MKFEHIKIAITFPTEPMAVMNFMTQGRGDILPAGSRWLVDGWWARTPTPEVIELAVKRTCEGRETPTGWRIVDDVPADRTYRNAWVDTGASIDHDMAKAKELHKEKLRQERVEKLLPLDTAYLRAMETGDTKAAKAVADEKQAYRDVTDDPRIAAAATVEDLKAVTLESARAVAAAKKG